MSRLEAATTHEASDGWYPSALRGPGAFLALAAGLAALGVGGPR